MNKKSLKFKLLAGLVMIVLIINLVPVMGNKVLAAEGGAGENMASYSGAIKLTYDTSGSSAEVSYTQTLRTTSSGYEWQFELDPRLTINEIKKDRLSSQNGYFTAPIAGDYLIELWGANGGAGGNGASGAGAGGKGGYLYGVVTLKAGDVLFYSIGGNGESTKSITDGAANGGSAHGGVGTKYVGSGGGYSAVYLFDEKGSFDGYLSSDKKTLQQKEILSKDRTSDKLIMLAGGGGGGGAVGEDNGHADGGDGGNFESSSGEKTGGGGTIFAGYDGKSSGPSLDYVGIGGYDVPGEKRVSEPVVLIGASQSKAGNSWEDGGQGGSGNLRGGAGGSGYNGGSGGVMYSYLWAYAIGGGGGGASFVSDKIDIVKAKSLPRIEINSSKSGGMIYITALDDSESNKFNVFRDINFEGTVSEYFTITDVSSNIGTVSKNGNSFSLSTTSENNPSSLIDMNGMPQKIVYTVNVKPIDGFMGGNDVPIFSDATLEGFSIKSMTDTVGQSIGVQPQCGYVNIPLAFEAEGKSLTINPGDTVQLSDLYGTIPVKPGNSETDYLKYAFIESIDSAYTVKDTDGTVITSSVSPTARTSYRVCYNVSPYSYAGKAVVGDELVRSGFEAESIVAIDNTGYEKINDDEIKLTKTLQKNGGNYELKIHGDVKINQESKSTSGEYKFTDFFKQTYSQGANFTKNIPAGTYYIKAWGGKGGDGGDVSEGKIDPYSAKGGAGADGSLVEGLLELSKDDVISGSLGSKGSNGSSDNNQKVLFIYDTYYGEGGKAGGYTELDIDSDTKTDNKTILIATGGAGGSGGYVGEQSGKIDGEQADRNVTILNTLQTSKRYISKYPYSSTIVNEEKYVSSNGSTPTYGNGKKTDAGETKTSYCDNKYFKTVTDADINLLIKDLPDEKTDDGGIVIYKLEKENDSYSFDNPFLNYTFSTGISEYFDIVNDGVTISGVDNGYSINTENGVVTISGINPTYTMPDSIAANTPFPEMSFDVVVKLIPKPGFLGGTDVPVIKQDKQVTLRQEDAVNSLSDDNIITTPENPASDYANVEINSTEIENIILSGANPFKVESEINYIIGYDSLKAEDIIINGTSLNSIEEWKRKFVSITDATGIDSKYQSLTADTNVPVTLSVSCASPEKAIVIPSVVDYSYTKYCKVNVKTSVAFDLTDLSVDAIIDDNATVGTESLPRTLLVPDGNDYICTFSVEDNFILPENLGINWVVSSSTGDDITSKCSYDNYTGELTIPGSELKEHSVVVKAVAGHKELKYNVTYFYQSKPGSDEYIPVIDKGPTGEGYKTNDKVYNMTDPNSIDSYVDPPIIEIKDVPGYIFVWDDEDDDDTVFTVKSPMGAADLTYVGYYVPIVYNITVNYSVNGGSASAPESVTEEHKYGETYSITSPTLSGYRAVIKGTNNSASVVSGKTSENTVINVEYVQITGQLVVDFVYQDNTVAKNELSFEIGQGTDYILDLAEGTMKIGVGEPESLRDVYVINGYDIYIDDGSGTLSKNTEDRISGQMGSSGITLRVVYVGKPVTVNFNANKLGVSNPGNIVVQYANTFGNILNANDLSTTYKDLPKLMADGFLFKGWKIANVEGYVTSGSKVSSYASEGITLIADWENLEYTVKIKLIDTYDSSTIASYDVSGEINSSQTYPLEMIEGYEIMTGTFGTTNSYSVSKNETTNAYEVKFTITGNRTINVEYERKKYSISVSYVDEEGKQIVGIDPINNTEYYKTSYSYLSPAPKSLGYDNCDKPVVSGVVPAQDVKVIVTYYYKTEEEIIISVKVEWGSLKFVYTQGEWNPDNHSYGESSLFPDPESGEEPKITITNLDASTVNINAELTYKKDKSFGSIISVFSKSKITELPPKESDCSTLTLSGNMPADCIDGYTYTVGSVNITLSRGKLAKNSET